MRPLRIDGWQKRFWAYLAAAREKPFAWGAHDCVMFATGAIDAVMGTDYYAQALVRYPYSTEAGAMGLMQQFGGITGLVESFLAPHVNWGQLTQGDVVLAMPTMLHGTAMETLCVHDGQQLVAAAPKGIQIVRFQYALHGWKIG